MVDALLRPPSPLLVALTAALPSLLPSIPSCPSGRRFVFYSITYSAAPLQDLGCVLSHWQTTLDRPGPTPVPQRHPVKKKKTKTTIVDAHMHLHKSIYIYILYIHVCIYVHKVQRLNIWRCYLVGGAGGGRAVGRAGGMQAACEPIEID